MTGSSCPPVRAPDSTRASCAIWKGESRSAGRLKISRARTSSCGSSGTEVNLTSGAVGVPVIASGGAGNAQHMVDAVRAGADAVLAASIFHFGEVSIGEVKAAMAAKGLPVRKDDTPEVFKTRFDAYRRQTAPLSEHYARTGMLETLDGMKPIDAVTQDLFGLLERHAEKAES